MQRKEQKTLTRTGRKKHARIVPGRPFRSLLVPHVLYIRARRQAGATWGEIAASLEREHSIQIGAAGVQRFYARTAKRTAWPLGMEPDTINPKAVAQEHAGPSAKGSLFGGTSRRSKEQIVAPTGDEPGKPRPYRSKINPHLPFIKEQRSARASWAQIADALRARKGVDVTRQAVAEFYSRTLARETRQRTEQTQGQPPAVALPPSNPISSPRPVADEFGGDDLDNLPPLRR